LFELVIDGRLKIEIDDDDDDDDDDDGDNVSDRQSVNS